APTEPRGPAFEGGARETNVEVERPLAAARLLAREIGRRCEEVARARREVGRGRAEKARADVTHLELSKSFGTHLAHHARWLADARRRFGERVEMHARLARRARGEEPGADRVEGESLLALQPHDRARLGARGGEPLLRRLRDARDGEPRHPCRERVAQRALALIQNLAQSPPAGDVTPVVP